MYACAASLCQGVADALVQEAAVGQFGQRVGVRVLVDLLLGRLALRNVDQNTGDIDGFPIDIVLQCQVRADPPVAAIVVLEPVTMGKVAGLKDMGDGPRCQWEGLRMK